MKTKLLRKIRRRYDWFFDPCNKKPVVLMDRRKRATAYFPNTQQTVAFLAFDFCGISTALDHRAKTLARIRRRNFYDSLKRFNLLARPR